MSEHRSKALLHSIENCNGVTGRIIGLERGVVIAAIAYVAASFRVISTNIDEDTLACGGWACCLTALSAKHWVLIWFGLTTFVLTLGAVLLVATERFRYIGAMREIRALTKRYVQPDSSQTAVAVEDFPIFYESDAERRNRRNADSFSWSDALRGALGKHSVSDVGDGYKRSIAIVWLCGIGVAGPSLLIGFRTPLAVRTVLIFLILVLSVVLVKAATAIHVPVPPASPSSPSE